MTDRVGAKDILADESGAVVDLSDKDNLYKTLDTLDAGKLSKLNDTIVRNQHIQTLKEVSDSIINKCY